MISFRPSMVLPVLGLLAAFAVGCSGEAAASGGADSADATRAAITNDQVATNDRPAFGKFRLHGPKAGPGFLIGAALHEDLKLTDAQRASIEALREEMKPAAPPAFDKSRASALAAQIRAGQISENAVDQGAPNDREQKRAEHLAATAKAVSKLHDILTPAQRTSLVAAVEKRMEQGPKHGERGPRGEGGERAQRGHRGEGGQRAHDKVGGPMGFLLNDLDLTQEQKDAIRTKLEAERPAAPSQEQREAMKARFQNVRAEMQSRLQSFASDSFDANAFVTPPARPEGAQARPHENRRAKMLAIVTSVLTPAQREKLAVKIEQGPQFKGAMHGRGLPQNAAPDTQAE